MDNQLKHLLLKVAALPLSDQRWLLKQLTPQQKKTFTQYKGTLLLYKARRFAHLSLPINKEQTPCLPRLCDELQNQPPLLVAIILEQGQFSWEKKFVGAYDYSLPIETVKTLKTATKVAVFNQWQKSLSFSEQLEVDHGSSI